MLKSLKITNYKAFRSGKIEFRPITVLLGKNSVGKSSLIELLNIFKQTFLHADETYAWPLKINGQFASAGDPRSLFHKGDVSKPFTVEFTLSESALIKQFIENSLRELTELVGRYGAAVVEFASESRKEHWERLGISDRLIYHRGEITEEKIQHARQLQQYLLNIKLDKTMLSRIERLLGPIRHRRPSKQTSHKGFYYIQNQQILYCLDFLAHLWRSPSLFTIGIDIGFNTRSVDRPLQMQRLYIHNNEQNILSGQREPYGTHLSSSLINFDKVEWLTEPPGTKPDNDQVINLENSVFFTPGTACTEETPNVLLEYLARFVKCAIDTLGDEFKPSTLNHIPPLRSRPKRYYFSEDSAVDGPLSNLVVETLINNSKVCNSVKKWLKRFEIDLKPVSEREVYYRLLVQQTNRSLELDITDIGFGISQVLPVITIAFLARAGSLSMIEQPEAHLHPKMQSALAELFDEASQASFGTKTVHSSYSETPNRDKIFLIETHSEYFLNKLAHLIWKSRHENSNLIGLCAKDISVHYIQSYSELEASLIQQVEVPLRGPFVLPDDFADEELDMLFDTLMGP